MSRALDVNLNSFDAEVLSASTPVLVDFWAGWCMPCKMLGPIVDEISDEFTGKIKVTKVNIESSQSLATEYGVLGIPTLLIFKNGKVVDRTVGVQPKAVITQKLMSALEA